MKTFQYLATVILFVLSIFFEPLNACNDPCKNSTICLRKVREQLYLECKDIMRWFKTSPENILVGTSTSDIKFPDDYNITYCADRKQNLVIKSLKSTDSGYNVYNAIVDGENLKCSYNIFVYDLDNFNGDLTINNISRPINDTEKPWMLEIDSFDANLKFQFSIESLPLTSLTVDNETIESDSCETSLTGLECRISKLEKIDTRRCVQNYNLSLSYGFNYSDEFKSVINQTKIFNHSIQVKYPPILMFNERNYEYKKEDTQIELECEVLCGNPDIYQYTWFYADNTILLKTDKTNLFNFSLESKTTKLIELFCMVDNSVKSSKNQSITRFLLSLKNETDGKQNESGLRDWELILIVVFGSLIVLIMIVSILITVLLYRKKRKNASKKEMNSSKLDTISSNFNLRQRQLNDEMTDNPIYGTVPFKLRRHMEQEENFQEKKGIQEGSETEKKNQTLV